MKNQYVRWEKLHAMCWLTVVLALGTPCADGAENAGDPINLLQNPLPVDGQGAWGPKYNPSWWTEEKARINFSGVENAPDGKPCFAVRVGHLSQMVDLPGYAGGKYALVIGQLSCDLLDQRKNRPGFPSDRGMGNLCLASHDVEHCLRAWAGPDERRPEGYVDTELEWVREGHGEAPYFNFPLPTKAGEWVTGYGIMHLSGTARRFEVLLGQSLNRDEDFHPAVRFRNLGLYLFDSLKEAEAFAVSRGGMLRKEGVGVGVGAGSGGKPTTGDGES